MLAVECLGRQVTILTMRLRMHSIACLPVRELQGIHAAHLGTGCLAVGKGATASASSADAPFRLVLAWDGPAPARGVLHAAR